MFLQRSRAENIPRKVFQELRNSRIPENCLEIEKCWDFLFFGKPERNDCQVIVGFHFWWESVHALILFQLHQAASSLAVGGIRTQFSHRGNVKLSLDSAEFIREIRLVRFLSYYKYIHTDLFFTILILMSAQGFWMKLDQIQPNFLLKTLLDRSWNSNCICLICLLQKSRISISNKISCCLITSDDLPNVFRRMAGLFRIWTFKKFPVWKQIRFWNSISMCKEVN